MYYFRMYSALRPVSQLHSMTNIYVTSIYVIIFNNMSNIIYASVHRLHKCNDIANFSIYVIQLYVHAYKQMMKDFNQGIATLVYRQGSDEKRVMFVYRNKVVGWPSIMEFSS